MAHTRTLYDSSCSELVSDIGSELLTIAAEKGNYIAEALVDERITAAL
jgi:hypothetical protein